MSALESVTVLLADLRAKVTFLEDQLAERTRERDEAQAATQTYVEAAAAGRMELDRLTAQSEADRRAYVEGTTRAGDRITELTAEVDALRDHVACARSLVKDFARDDINGTELRETVKDAGQWLLDTDGVLDAGQEVAR